MSADRIDRARAWDRIDRALRENAVGRISAADVCAVDFELQELVDPGQECCCDDVRACPPCFARADELVGRRVRDAYGHEWEVVDVGEKDGFATIAGAGRWARPDEVEVLDARPDLSVGGRRVGDARPEAEPR